MQGKYQKNGMHSAIQTWGVDEKRGEVNSVRKFSKTEICDGDLCDSAAHVDLEKVLL
jgi:hypothetical protein